MSDPSSDAAGRWRVVADHTSEYPEPITFPADAPLAVGERYAGPEGWEDWWFCETPGQQGGWVPAQVIERLPDGLARSREAYTARELDVRTGDVLTGTRQLNGWLWACAVHGSVSGWVPLANLVALPD